MRAAPGRRRPAWTTCGISFGEARGRSSAFKAIHRYGHSGKVTLSISAIDKAGNTVAKTREITIRK